jgi:sterol 3beta-glucosyltransferase
LTELKSYRSKPFSLENLRCEPISAGTNVLLDTMTIFTIGFSEIFTGPAKAFKGKENGGGGKEAAKTFGTGFGEMVAVLPKATLVDFPLALKEGLHQMPRLYGDTVRNHGKVKDWKSMLTVDSFLPKTKPRFGIPELINNVKQNFGYGFMDGLSGTITKPYKGAKENGWTGFGTGLAKDVAGLVTGPGSGMFGLFA